MNYKKMRIGLRIYLKMKNIFSMTAVFLCKMLNNRFELDKILLLYV